MNDKCQVWDRHLHLPPLVDQGGKLVVVTGGGRGIGEKAVRKLVCADHGLDDTFDGDYNDYDDWMTGGGRGIGEKAVRKLVCVNHD